MPSGLSYLTFWTGPFPIEGVSGLFLSIPCFIESPVLTVASDLGLHCLPMSHL